MKHLKKIMLFILLTVSTVMVVPTKSFGVIASSEMMKQTENSDSYEIKDSILLAVQPSESINYRLETISFLREENEQLFQDFKNAIMERNAQQEVLDNFNREYDKDYQVEYKEVCLDREEITFASFDYIPSPEEYIDALDVEIEELEEINSNLVSNRALAQKQIKEINKKIEKIENDIEIEKNKDKKKNISNSVSISNTYVQGSGCLTRQGGVFYGPSGKETYYNLNMSGVVAIMRNMGYSEEEYPYWIREDGCKMLGNYIIVAANLNVYPRGSLVPTSLGTGIVCDTGGFVSNGSGVALDIATAW